MSDTILQKMQLIHQKEEEIAQLGKELFSDFSAYITDKSVPLLSRWSFFINAHDRLKGHESYIPDFKTDGMEYVREKLFEDGEYQRGNVVYLRDVFSMWVEPDHFDVENFEISYDDETRLEKLQEAMEEVLTMNIATFDFDW
jgi:hypothetical protein